MSVFLLVHSSVECLVVMDFPRLRMARPEFLPFNSVRHIVRSPVAYFVFFLYLMSWTSEVWQAQDKGLPAVDLVLYLDIPLEVRPK